MEFSSLSNIAPSATLAINGKALQKRAAGERVYNLSAGDLMVDTDARIVEAAYAAMNEGKTHYTPIAGIPELREAASSWMNRTYNTSFSVDETLITSGGKAAVNVLMQSILNPDDEVVVIAPYWVSYTSIAELYGADVVVVQTEEGYGWKVAPEQLRKACSPKTKIIVFNNASNPTGVLYTQDELESLIRVAHEQRVLFVSDEVYSGLVYEGSYISAGSFDAFRSSVAIVQSASKNFAMTGWRVGVLCAPHELIVRCKTVQGQNTTCASSMCQWGMVQGYTHAEDIIERNKECMQKRRDVFIQTFNELFPQSIVAPQSALYCFIPLSAFGTQETDSVTFCARVLEEANVAMVPGIAFGKEGYVRCSFGADETELKEALHALATYLV